MARTKRTVQEPGRSSPLLEDTPVERRAGEPSPTHDTLASARVVGLRGTEEAPATREVTGKGNRSRGRRGQGVGGLHTSEDVGEQGDTWTRPSKGGPCRCDLQEGTMPNALTLEIMSPGLLKVGGTRNPEPHRRKSRMREIRSSGSGEGLGWATSQPTLQRPFGGAPSGAPRAAGHPAPPLLPCTPPAARGAARPGQAAPGGVEETCQVSHEGQRPCPQGGACDGRAYSAWPSAQTPLPF